MTKTKRYRLLFALAAALVVVGSFFATRFVVWDFRMDAPNYSFTEGEAGSGFPVTFSYGKEGMDLRYHLADGASARGVAWYYRGDTGVGEFEPGSLPPDAYGNVIAVVGPYDADVDGDGSRETVHDFARTDFGPRSLHPAPQVYDDARIPFEIVFSMRNTMLLRLDGEPLSNQAVQIADANGQSQEYRTDGSGAIVGLPVQCIREGFVVTCRNGADAYRSFYVFESYPVGSPHYWKAQAPLALVFGAAIVLVVVGVLWRRRERTGGLASHVARPAFDGLVALRYTLLVAATLFFTFGGAATGLVQAFNNIAVPVFACPYNIDQIVEVPCYYLSHLPELMNRGGTGPIPENLAYAAWFFGTLLVLVAVFGRLFCGFLCPAGLLQDIVFKLRGLLHIRPVRIDERKAKGFAVLKWTWIVLFVGLVFTGTDFCNICPIRVFNTAQGGYWTNLYLGGILSAALLAGSFFVERFWCLMCPFGYLIGLLKRFNVVKLEKRCNACTGCGACYAACPMRIKEVCTERESADVQSHDCLLCGECARKCPEDGALALTLFGKEIYWSKRERVLRRYAHVEREHEAD